MRIWRLSPAILILLAACVDLSAVTKFAQTAPDVTKLDALTDVYVSDLQTLSDYAAIWQSPDPDLQKNIALRQSEKVTFDDLHALIVNYIKAVGGLAGASATDLSTQAKSVGTNLTALQKKDPHILSTAQVSSLSDLILVVPQGVLNIWRESEIGSIIKQNQKAFHVMVSTEITIVQNVYLLDFDNTKGQVVGDRDHMKSDLGRSGGSSAIRAAQFTFQRDAASDIARLDAATAAAKQYVSALTSLAKAYDTLVDQSGHFSAATLQAILPDLMAAQKAYQDIKSY